MRKVLFFLLADEKNKARKVSDLPKSIQLVNGKTRDSSSLRLSFCISEFKPYNMLSLRKKREVISSSLNCWDIKPFLPWNKNTEYYCSTLCYIQLYLILLCLFTSKSLKESHQVLSTHDLPFAANLSHFASFPIIV